MDKKQSSAREIDNIITEDATLSEEQLLENFKVFSDQTRLSLFLRMTKVGATPYDKLLQIWWMNRY